MNWYEPLSKNQACSILTSALAIWDPIFDPFLPDEGTDSSEMARIARRLVSVLPDPTAPLRISLARISSSDEGAHLVTMT
jgi:hypothetical protein